MRIDLSGQVAIVTGGGAGLGRSHALALARQGALVLVNDVNVPEAERVCANIRSKGGDAIANGADVSDLAQVKLMVGEAEERWGRVDILVNNAGILRDRTFGKMDLVDFKLVLEVHVMGAINCTKAVWAGMCERNYGRIIYTTSSSGLFGNFGQSNYGAAKMALVGLMQTLALEGERYGIRVNCVAPSAATAMTNDLYPDDLLAGLGPDLVSPAIVALASASAPTKRILLAGAGCFEEAHVTMTRGIYIGAAVDAAEQLIHKFADVGAREGDIVPKSGDYQYRYEVGRAVSK